MWKEKNVQEGRQGKENERQVKCAAAADEEEEGRERLTTQKHLRRNDQRKRRGRQSCGKRIMQTRKNGLKEKDK